jgi:hypothetical protein
MPSYITEKRRPTETLVAGVLLIARTFLSVATEFYHQCPFDQQGIMRGKQRVET